MFYIPEVSMSLDLGQAFTFAFGFSFLHEIFTFSFGFFMKVDI